MMYMSQREEVRRQADAAAAKLASQREESRRELDAAIAKLASELRASQAAEASARTRVSDLEAAVQDMAQRLEAARAGSGNGVDYLVYQWHLRRSTLEQAQATYSDAKKKTASLQINEQILMQQRNAI
jgi:hypothetical protein